MLTGNYWDGLLVDPFAALEREPRSASRCSAPRPARPPRQYARYLPDTQVDAVEIDGELLDIGRRYFDLEDRPQLRTIAEDARPFLRRSDGALRRDHGRRLPAALHPLLPDDQGVLRARPRAAGAGRRRSRSTSGTRRARTGSRRCSRATLRSVFANVARDPLNADQHDPDGLRRAADRRAAARRARRRCPPTCARSRCARPRRLRPGAAPAAASTPTTTRRSSGWSTSRSSSTRPASRARTSTAHVGGWVVGRTRIEGAPARAGDEPSLQRPAATNAVRLTRDEDERALRQIHLNGGRVAWRLCQRLGPSANRCGYDVSLRPHYGASAAHRR